MAEPDGMLTDPSKSTRHGDCFVHLGSSHRPSTGAGGTAGTEGWRGEEVLHLLGSTNDRAVKMGRCSVGEGGFDAAQTVCGNRRLRRQFWSSGGVGWGRDYV